MKSWRYLITAIALTGVLGCSGGGDDDSNGPGPNDGPEPSVCLSSFGNAKVINGDFCSGNNSPVVRINMLAADGTSGLCSGTVIASDKILTAAHCFVITEIIAAAVEIDGQQIPINTVFVHPNVGTDGVNLALFNDVAVAMTTQPMNRPALGIVTSQPVQPGDQISIQGFGLDENGQLGVNKGGTMTVSDITPNHIFASFDGEGQNSCNGDSGGPAFLTIENNGQTFVGVVGVVSSGNPETGCFEGDVTLFANLQNPEMLNFVQSIVPGLQTL